MEDVIRAAIERQGKKLIERQKRDRFAATKYQRRFRLRTGETPKPACPREPDIWGISPHFNPKYCIRHSKFLAKTIWRKLSDRVYDVQPAVLFQIPKDSGGYRDIMVFSIPDTAVANVFNRKLRDRNTNRQSPFCYSYRADRSIFDAILHTQSLLHEDKIFIIQYDFAKYFDSIKHEYINFLLDSDSFFISPMEKYIIRKFLKHQYFQRKDYNQHNKKTREIGVPQGCSLSLFLSNIAAHELDKALEQSNGMFVRFADDIVCIAKEYGDADKIKDAFISHCHYTGISINFEKSPGIRLLSAPNNNENRDYFIDNEDIGKIYSIREFDYIGHKFTRDSVKISDRGIKRIKQRISRIIYLHLLHNLKRNMFSSERVGREFYDWDLVTCINEIRNYVYGGLREKQLKSFVDNNKRISRFKGLMSFYPLVTSVSQFSELDGWLVSVLRRAIKKRSKMIDEYFNITINPISEAEIIEGSWYKFQSGITLETRAPSFVLGWRAARKAFKQYGLTDFETPSYYSSMFEGY